MFAVMDDGALVPQCSSAVASVTLNDWTVDTVDRAKNALYKRGRPMSRMHIRSIMHLYCYAIALRKCRALCSCYVLDSQFFSCIEHFLMTVDTEIQMIDLILCRIFSSQNPGAGPECPHCSRLHQSVASCAGAGLGDDGDRWARVGTLSTQSDLVPQIKENKEEEAAAMEDY